MRMRLTLTTLFLACRMYAGYAACTSVTTVIAKIPSTQINYAMFVCANGTDSGSNCDATGHPTLSIPNLRLAPTGLVTNSNGYDIGLFSDRGITPLSYDLDSYNGTTGYVNLHVNIASLSSSVANLIYLCYGNPTVTTNQSSTATYNSNTKLVWHLPNGTSLVSPVVDSTASGINGTLSNTPTATAYQINGGAHFLKASTQSISNTSSSPVTAFPLTLQAWVKLSDTTFAAFEARAFVSAWTGTAGSVSAFWMDYLLNNTTPQLRCNALNTAQAAYITYNSIGAFDTNSHQITCVFNSSGSTTLYLDGVALTPSTTGSGVTPSSSTKFSVGVADPGATNYGPMQGDIDEVRAFNNARTADQVLIDYRNTGQPYDFYTFGPEVLNKPVQHRVVQ